MKYNALQYVEVQVWAWLLSGYLLQLGGVVVILTL